MRMDVYTLRRFNLRKLKQRFKTWSALAERMDIDASYLSCIAGPNPTRKIGDDLAAKIEQATGLVDGQLSSLSLALDLPDQDLESALLAADAGALQLVLTILKQRISTETALALAMVIRDLRPKDEQKQQA